MTEPNVIRSKRQHIEAGTTGSYFGPLPKCYGMCIYLLCIAMHCDPSIPHCKQSVLC